MTVYGDRAKSSWFVRKLFAKIPNFRRGPTPRENRCSCKSATVRTQGYATAEVQFEGRGQCCMSSANLAR